MNSRRPSNRTLILILGSLATVSPFSIDMYLPAFPEIARALGSTVAQVSLSVSSYFVGFALAQVFYGPLLDRFGRKRPLAGGLGLYILATIGCFFSKSVEALIAFRVLQAFGGSAAMVSSTAMVRDFFPVKEGAKVFSLLVLILGVSPLLAPTVGGFVVTWLGWQAVFALLAAIVSAILAIAMIALPEGQEPDPSVSLRLRPILRSYGAIFRDRQFVTYSLAGAFSFSGLFVYVAGSPAIFMGVFGVDAKTYGGIFAMLSVGFIASSQFNIPLTKRFGSPAIFRTALTLQFATSCVFLLGTLLGWYGLTAFIALFFVLLATLGLCGPNSSALALAPFSKNAGSASAMLGFVQIGTGAIASTGIGLLNIPGSLPTVAILAITSGLALATLLFGSRRIPVLIAGDEDGAVRDF